MAGGCICEGNWRNLVAEYESLFGRDFEYGGAVYRFFGLVYADDDFYYGMSRMGDHAVHLISCVGDLETSWGAKLLPKEGDS